MKYCWVLLFKLYAFHFLFSQETLFEVNVQVDSVHQRCQLEIYSDSMDMQAFCFYELQIGTKLFLLDSLCFDAYTSSIKLCLDISIGNRTLNRQVSVPMGKVSIFYSYRDSMCFRSYDIKWLETLEVPCSNQQCIDFILMDTTHVYYDFENVIHPPIDVVYINVWLEKKDSAIEFIPKEIRIGDSFSIPVVPGYLYTKNISEHYLVRQIRDKMMVHMGSLVVPAWKLRKHHLKEYFFSMSVNYIQTANGKIGEFRVTLRTTLK